MRTLFFQPRLIFVREPSTVPRPSPPATRHRCCLRLARKALCALAGGLWLFALGLLEGAALVSLRVARRSTEGAAKLLLPTAVSFCPPRDA